MKAQKEWFESWFSSPYYHILYKNRDDEEAAKFIDNIINFLDPVSNAKILDAACGKGRHSIYLNEKGFDVFQVSLDRDKSTWMNAIETDNLGQWSHVSDLKFWKSEAAIIYNIKSIPASFFLDPEGRIIAKNLRGRLLEKKLLEIFNQI